ncbi:MAG: hypothetical protein ACLFUH_02860 [Bacteroidales bacterium]
MYKCKFQILVGIISFAFETYMFREIHVVIADINVNGLVPVLHHVAVGIVSVIID